MTVIKCGRGGEERGNVPSITTDILHTWTVDGTVYSNNFFQGKAITVRLLGVTKVKKAKVWPKSGKDWLPG